MNERPAKQVIQELVAENRKLRRALAGLIPWAGESPEGPSWATPAAKRRNRLQFEQALRAACDCFPPDYNGFDDALATN